MSFVPVSLPRLFFDASRDQLQLDVVFYSSAISACADSTGSAWPMALAIFRSARRQSLGNVAPGRGTSRTEDSLLSVFGPREACFDGLCILTLWIWIQFVWGCELGCRCWTTIVIIACVLNISCCTDVLEVFQGRRLHSYHSS